VRFTYIFPFPIYEGGFTPISVLPCITVYEEVNLLQPTAGVKKNFEEMKGIILNSSEETGSELNKR
jgi:hypothetical protein